MKGFNLGGKLPRCPLCHEWMEREWVAQRCCFVFACAKDRVAIRVDDPFVGRWEVALDKTGMIVCPRPGCETKMRYFATSVGFMKAVCPKKGCGATISNSEPDRLKDIVYTPEAPGALQ